MMFKKLTHPHKQDPHSKKTTQDMPDRALTPEERSQMFREMSTGWGMMSTGGFPDGIWHLY